MKVAVHQPQYLPWLGYFDKIAKCDCFVFLDEVQYKVREFQNRNKIRTTDGSIWLTVPVLCHGRPKIKDILIDNETDWKKKHLKSIETFYHKAPFFDKYYAFFEELYSKEWKKLVEINIAIISYFLRELGIKTEIKLESEIGTSTMKTERIIEICKKLNADTYLSGAGAKAYLDANKLVEEGIRLEYQQYNHPEYRQCFEPFVSHLSVVDLLFNEGDNSYNILAGN
ncbi:WbqC family protein [Candidatus Margulisiibacteriota bacterium]